MFKDAGVAPDRVMREAYKTFIANTPVRTGRARRSTSLDNLTINAVYPYAQKLDEGYSRQSPKGMTDPTLAEIERLINKEIGKL